MNATSAEVRIQLVSNQRLLGLVLSVSKILIASIFSNHRNYRTKRDTSDINGKNC